MLSDRKETTGMGVIAVISRFVIVVKQCICGILASAIYLLSLRYNCIR